MDVPSAFEFPRDGFDADCHEKLEEVPLSFKASPPSVRVPERSDGPRSRCMIIRHEFLKVKVEVDGRVLFSAVDDVDGLDRRAGHSKDEAGFLIIEPKRALDRLWAEYGEES